MSTPAAHLPERRHDTSHEGRPSQQPESTPLRFVTAASLFDGHDAAINIMRRLIQAQGAEVIHLGHNRSVEDVVRAALQEDADAIALSSYQGGHVEYFKYMVDMLRERGAAHVRVFGGGGGTITPEEIRELEAYGVERIYHPNDGMKMGLVEMIEDVVRRAQESRDSSFVIRDSKERHPAIDDEIAIGRMLSAIEDGAFTEPELALLRKGWANPHTNESRITNHESRRPATPVVGITGTGGAGKSSVTDELLNRFLASFPQMRIAVISVDPTRRRTGGALLGDRIRMNSLRSHRVYMRSMATRRQNVATNAVLKDCIGFLKSLGFDLVIVETAGIGQSDSEIVDLVDFPMYVMTSDYGAASQLEKIDMLDYAELIVLNKYDKRGAEDALRDIRKQWKRNRTAFQAKDEDIPVYPTIASQFNDPGISWMFVNLCRLLRQKLSLEPSAPRREQALADQRPVSDRALEGDARGAGGPGDAPAAGAPEPSPSRGGLGGDGFPQGRCDFNPRIDTTLKEPRATVLIPGSRVRYLAEIAEQGRAINAAIEKQAEAADRAQAFWQALRELEDPKLPRQLDLYDLSDVTPAQPPRAVVPAQAGTHGRGFSDGNETSMDARLRGHDETGIGRRSDDNGSVVPAEAGAHGRGASHTSVVPAQAGTRGRGSSDEPATSMDARLRGHDGIEGLRGHDGIEGMRGNDGIEGLRGHDGIENVRGHHDGGATRGHDDGGANRGNADAAPDRSLLTLRQRYNDAVQSLTSENLKLLRDWPQRLKSITDEVNEYQVRGKTIRVENYRESLSHQKIPKIAAPTYRSWGELLTFLGKENLPGSYPYTGGVYPYRRTGEDPIRMFAGEGTPERTNRRFHYLSLGQPAARLSTAFDSVTLYGEDPAPRPDIYGKIGNSGVNIPTLDDMKKLYSGFDLCAPTTSVSMTINGPAPIILALFMNTAIDQQVEKYLKADPARWAEAERKIEAFFEGRERPRYHGELPKGNDGLGLSLLGMTGDQLVDADTYARIKAETLATVRGTVQADILKEDQAQNTCIFSTEFALRMMGDIQQYFVDHKVRNFYSVSISGYHIAEAGANPISQLAFTLSNGFTIVEYYLARGMKIDDFAPNLSFFFSNGMDPEYTVIGRVARRIWARAMRERYGGNERSQMMKYHIQTSGRSLHAQEIQFNDIRTTLQALYALFDNCNSLHTNAYDEAITTPTEESVRRAVAIQMIINKELGLNFCENPWQGSFIVDQLTDLVEEAVYKEFEAISERGGVLGAMDTMYQRGKIQEESLYYEHKKHDGSLPLVGVNTFLPKEHAGEVATEIELIRSTEEEKAQQIENVRRWQQSRNVLAPAGETEHGHVVEDEAAAATEPHDGHGLAYLQKTARERRNVFAALMEAVKTHSLGQISHALYDVGGEYRRNM